MCVFESRMQEEEGVLEEALLEQRWQDALASWRRLADVHHCDPPKMWAVLGAAKIDVAQLLAEDTGSSLFLLGKMLRYGRGGVDEDREQAYACFQQAAAKGHLASLYQQGDMDGDGPLVLQAAQMGCRAAYPWIGYAYTAGHKGMPQDFRQGALWLLRAGLIPFELLAEHPLECAPLGAWTPELAPLVPWWIARAQKQVMLLCKRFQVPRDVALLICSFVCTEPAPQKPQVLAQRSEK